jgi:flagellar basal body L-ring protein FlgH
MMKQMIKYVLSALAIFMLSACVVNGGRRELQSAHKITPKYESGAIFKTGLNERPLYEARRPRNIGDGLMMTVTDIAMAENKSATKDKADNAAKRNKDKSEREKKDSREDRNANENEDKPGFANIDSSLLLGIVSMTVTEVLDNGNMVVTGGRLVNIDEEDRRFLRVTGVIDPRNVSDNTISSTQVADAQVLIENVRGDGRTSRSSDGSNAFGNFFQSIQAR